VKERTKGFLRDEIISHDSEVFDYISELHDYLWQFCRILNPGTGGHLHNIIDAELLKLKNLIQTFKEATK
jgi:hypothetical protein